MTNRDAGLVEGARFALPAWRSVLAVVAHPDDESFGLGAVLTGFAVAGATNSVLCFTQGEASTLGEAAVDLRAVRARELDRAAAILGVREAALLRYPDGHLSETCLTRLAGDVVDAARAAAADGILVFDATGVTGHPDHAAATAAAVAAAAALDLPVLGWTLPESVADALNGERGATFVGAPQGSIDYVVSVDRTRQRAAIAAHASQAVAGSVLWRRLELQGEVEYLRLLRGREAREFSPPPAGWKIRPGVSGRELED